MSDTPTIKDQHGIDSSIEFFEPIPEEERDRILLQISNGIRQVCVAQGIKKLKIDYRD